MLSLNTTILEGTCDSNPRGVVKLNAIDNLGKLINSIAECRGSELAYGFITHKDHVVEIERAADAFLTLYSIMYMDGLDMDIVQQWIEYKQAKQMFKDYQTMEKEGIPEGLESYYHRCKEVYDAYGGDEAKVEDDVPQI